MGSYRFTSTRLSHASMFPMRLETLVAMVPLRNRMAQDRIHTSSKKRGSPPTHEAGSRRLLHEIGRVKGTYVSSRQAQHRVPELGDFCDSDGCRSQGGEWSQHPAKCRNVLVLCPSPCCRGPIRRVPTPTNLCVTNFFLLENGFHIHTADFGRGQRIRPSATIQKGTPITQRSDNRPLL